MNDKINTIYSKQEFLNPEKSPSTGAVAAFLGYFNEDKDDPLAMWLRISDCHNTISLHKADWDTTEEFINKLEKLNMFIEQFINKLYKFKNGELDVKS